MRHLQVENKVIYDFGPYAEALQAAMPALKLHTKLGIIVSPAGSLPACVRLECVALGCIRADFEPGLSNVLAILVVSCTSARSLCVGRDFSLSRHSLCFALLCNRAQGGYGYFDLSLKPLAQYAALRSGVFQSLREIGNTLIFIENRASPRFGLVFALPACRCCSVPQALCFSCLYRYHTFHLLLACSHALCCGGLQWRRC